MKTRPIFWLVAILTSAAVSVTFFAFQPSHAAGPWYVAPGGSDGHDCLSPATACATIDGALNKPGFVAGDTILVATGLYTGTGDQVVLLDKNVTLSGGWDASFTTQSGTATIDGQRARMGLSVDFGIIAVVEHFTIQNGAGGGIYNNCGSPGHLTLNGSTISGNTTEGHGGGIYNYGTLTLNSSTVSGNHAAGSGGGIHNYYVAVTLNNSVISGNTAGEYGGGIYNSGYSDSIVTLNNSTVFGNMAWIGGGFYNVHSTLALNNATVSANSSTSGAGGIYTWEGAVTLQNSILGGNTAAGSPDCSGTALGSAGYNLVGSTSGCTFGASTGDLTDVDPRLGLLIGSPGYLPLMAGSPAIDAGDPGGCTGSAGLLTTDQRGAARAGRCDIGAYEYTIPGPPASVYAWGGTPQTTPPFVAFRTPLQAVVLDGIGSPVGGATVSFLAPASGAGGTFADSGTTFTAVTAESGIATAATFTANGQSGSYPVLATAAGVVTPASFLLGNLAWYVSPGGNDANDCRTPATSCATINGALNKPGFIAGDTVVAAIGVYTGTGAQVVVLDRDVILSGGWDAGCTTQSGYSTIDGEGARRGITVKLGATVMVERFGVKNGNGGSYGGGIHNGGILTLNNCSVSGNVVSSGEYYSMGGGIYNLRTATLNHCTISGNTSDMYGGGIYSAQHTLTLNYCTVSGNTANRGGGVFSSIGTVTVQNSILRDNAASLGGGIYQHGGTTTLNNSAIGNNTVNSAGGGIYDYQGRLTLNTSAVTGNMASGYGGGISNEAGSDAGTVTLNNSTVGGNTAGEYCGGVGNGGTLALYSSTIGANTAGISGGGLCNDGGNATLVNSILGANMAGSAPDCRGTIGSAGYNLVGNTSGCAFGATTDDLIDVDPNLGPLEGLPAYQPLLPGSPAVNGGNPAGCNDGTGNPLPTDQRGFPRFGRCDIGAYELQPLGFSTQAANPPVANRGDPVTFAIVLKNPGATDLPDVRVTDTLPGLLIFVDDSLTASSGSYGYQDSVITWAGTVSAGNPVTITYEATVKPTIPLGTTVANPAVISGGGEMITRTASVTIPPARVYLPFVSDNYEPFSDNLSHAAGDRPIADTVRFHRACLSGEHRRPVCAVQP